MNEKQLRKLRRADLLEMLIEQSRETESLRNEVKELRQKLEEREIKLEKAGSIAEAALQLNSVWEAAEAAAAQYLENLKRLSNEQEAERASKK